MTEEMKEIIESQERHIVISAKAGTGKSSTIKEHVKANQKDKALYLVFSADMKREAESKFKGLKNCEIRTIHSLCYRKWVEKNRNTRYFGMSNLDIMKQLRDVSQLEISKLFDSYKLEYKDLSEIAFYYNAFLCSNKQTAYELQANKEGDEKYFQFVDILYKHHRDNYVPIPHNFYLKDFSLSNPKLDGYDTIYLDECQDINDASLNIITANNLDKKIIAVGDSSQSIYGFMHCKNAIKVLKEDYNFKEYKLTTSFRISEDVASMCSKLLNWFYSTDTMTFHGVNETKFINIDFETFEGHITILTRTRIGGIVEALNYLDINPDGKIFYYGGLESYGLKEVENMLKFNGVVYIDGEKYHINTLRKMKSEGLDDNVINAIISRYDFIKKHDDCIKKLRESEVKNIKDANISLSTLHACKGATFETVKLGGDIGGVNALKRRYKLIQETGIEFNITGIENECNLLYVGLSRATKYLDIGDAFSKEKEDKMPTKIDLVKVRKVDKPKTKNKKLSKI